TGFDVLPEIIIDSSEVTINNVRNFRYISEDSFIVDYYNRIYILDKLESLWFVLSPFADHWRGPAHSFLSFEFSDSQYVSISVEARKEVGESYSIIGGMLKKFELMYVVGDERDLIGLRTVIWDDDVFVYPIKTEKNNIRKLFIDVLERAQKLQAEPEFYNTIWSNCTSTLYDHVNKIWPRRLPGGWKLILTGYSDELVYDNDLINTTLSLEEARQYFRVNDRAKKYFNLAKFSVLIRNYSD
ncbi:MAG: DUF4105 domain-containing protein, partial [Calditrichaceae bacterium]|nr:DUF4105 domain-containing protein [Calditrichaceae bacterium]